ncbi:MAG: glycosyltransferase family 4 protein [Candidatus Cloacimonetes bacterium]|nr:glycosyltransferase family 4 protein [Candidatus Cloacimonadota bacterium]
MTKKLKVLHIQVLPILSGVQLTSLNIFKYLQGKYDFWLLCAPDADKLPTSFITESQKLGVTVVTSSHLKREIGIHDVAAFKEIYQLVKREHFDIVHTQSSKPGVIGRIAARLAGCPRVIHTLQGHAFHAYEPIHKRALYYGLEVFSGLFCDAIVSVNKTYLRYFWFKPKRGKLTIYNSADFSRLQKKKTRDDDEVRLVFVGRLDRAKSPMDFLYALRIVLAQTVNVRVKIVGDGTYLPRMREFVALHRMQDRVELCGWLPSVAEVLAESDIFCLTSIYEAFGIVFAEAGFVGLPSVATRVEGIPEVVIHNKTGLLVPPRRPDLFAQALLTLINDASLRRQMGSAAESRVTQFSPQNMVERYEQLYNG